ncbi:hypothetical protein ES703_40824 [subsurface metagenome]
MLLFAGGEKIARDCSLRSPFGASSLRSSQRRRGGALARAMQISKCKMEGEAHSLQLTADSGRLTAHGRCALARAMQIYSASVVLRSKCKMNRLTVNSRGATASQLQISKCKMQNCSFCAGAQKIAGDTGGTTSRTQDAVRLISSLINV